MRKYEQVPATLQAFALHPQRARENPDASVQARLAQQSCYLCYLRYLCYLADTLGPPQVLLCSASDFGHVRWVGRWYNETKAVVGANLSIDVPVGVAASSAAL